MDYYYIPNSAPLTEEQKAVESEEIARRKPRRTVSDDDKHAGGGLAAAAAAAGAGAIRGEIHRDLGQTLYNEFDEIRNNPELKAKEMRDLIQTYENFVKQTGNPVEFFVNQPGSNMWAAGIDTAGNDIVYWDSTAPHAAVMAHELGHVHMNHANPILDPLAGLQQSGIGRWSGNNAGAIGSVGALMGALAGRAVGKDFRSQAIGTAAGGGLGVVGGSGNFAYELGGASGRALGYLPEDDDKMDAAGDLLRAGMTYGMAGPGHALVGALAAGAGVTAATHPAIRRYAGQIFNQA